MKYVKYGAYALAGLVVVFVAIVAYIAATFDPNAYKGEIVRAVNEQTGRNLTIEGDIGLMFFPKIGVTLGPTRLSERGSDAEFAGVDDVRVALSLLPLLSKRVVVDEIVVDGLRARIIKHADGSMNIDDLAKSGEQAQTKESAQTTEPSETSAFELDIEGVRIVNGALSYTDEQAGAHYAVSELNLETGRVAPGVPTQFEYGARVQADEPKVDLRTRAAGTLEADTAAQVFKVTGLDAGAEGMAATVSQLKLTVGAGEIESQPALQTVGLRQLSLRASGAMGEDRFNVDVSTPKLLLEKNAVTIEQLVATLGGVFAGAELSEGRLDVPALAMNLDTQHIDLKGITLRAAGKQAENSFTVKLDAPSLAVTPEKASGDTVVLALQARGPAVKADANVRLAAVSGSARALNIGELVLDVDAQQADNSIKGRISTPIKGDLERQIFSLPKIVGQFDVASPALPMKSTTVPLTGNVDADVKGEKVEVNLKTRFDESNIEAAVALSQFAKLFIRFDASVDKLDLDRYTSKETAQEKPAAAGGEDGESNIDLSALKDLNLDGKLRIGQLVASKVKLSDVRLTVKAADGKLEINPLLANLYGGTLRSVITADANTNRFSVKQNLSAVTIGPLLQDALSQDLLDGRGSVDLDLVAQGDTMTALTKTLTGNAGVALKDGAIKGINLAQSLRGASDMLSLKRNTETAASKTEKTDFSDLKASFRIDNGQARNEDLSLSSPFIRLNGSGQINLVEGTVDYLAKTSLVATSAGQGGETVDDVAGFTVPVHVSGPLTALKYRLQFSDAVKDQSKQLLKAEEAKLKQKLEAQEEQAKSKLETQLKDKLLKEDTSTAEESAAEAAPAEEPKEELKQRLKKLLR